MIQNKYLLTKAEDKRRRKLTRDIGGRDYSTKYNPWVDRKRSSRS